MSIIPVIPEAQEEREKRIKRNGYSSGYQTGKRQRDSTNIMRAASREDALRREIKSLKDQRMERVYCAAVQGMLAGNSQLHNEGDEPCSALAIHGVAKWFATNAMKTL